ncbi:hypothetical protein REPUB_Repub07fG0090300 [Reevesia pubescens]
MVMSDIISKWSPPSVGYAKINIDAAIFCDLDAIGVGVAIRDYAGDVLALLSSKIRGRVDPFVAECISLREALKFDLNIGIRDVEVERDSMLTVYAVTKSQVDHSIAGGIVEAIKLQVPHFNKFRINHVKRDGNSITHAMAKHSRYVVNFQAWIEKVPYFLHALILNDCKKESTSDVISLLASD